MCWVHLWTLRRPPLVDLPLLHLVAHLLDEEHVAPAEAPEPAVELEGAQQPRHLRGRPEGQEEEVLRRVRLVGRQAVDVVEQEVLLQLKRDDLASEAPLLRKVCHRGGRHGCEGLKGPRGAGGGAGLEAAAAASCCLCSLLAAAAARYCAR